MQFNATPQQDAAQFPPLESVTKPNLTTAELAYYFDRKPQTIYCWACHENGPLRPTRIAGRLAWNTLTVKTLAGVNQQGAVSLVFLAAVLAIIALLAVLVLAPEIFTAMDWHGVGLLGAGVTSLYSPTSAPFKIVRVCDFEIEPVHPEAKRLGRNIGHHILENAARGHDEIETTELIADALERCAGLLPEHRADVLTAVAMEIVDPLRSALGLQGWPSFGQKVATK